MEPLVDLKELDNTTVRKLKSVRTPKPNSRRRHSRESLSSSDSDTDRRAHLKTPVREFHEKMDKFFEKSENSSGLEEEQHYFKRHPQFHSTRKGRARPANLDTSPQQLILSPQNSDSSLPIDSLLDIPTFGDILDQMLPAKPEKPKHHMPTKKVSKKVRIQLPGAEIPVDIKINHGPEERSPAFQDEELLHKLDNLILNKQKNFEKYILSIYDKKLDQLINNVNSRDS